jgi:O-antigen ligase
MAPRKHLQKHALREDRTRYLLLSVAIVVASFGTFTAYGVETGSYTFPKWCFFALGALCAGLASSARLVRATNPSVDGVDAATCAVVLYAAMSLAWSPDPGAGALALLYISAAAVLFAALRRIDPRTLALLVAGSGMLAAAVVLARIVAKVEEFGGFGNRNVVAEFLLFILPSCAVWWHDAGKRFRWLAPLVAAPVLVYLFGGFNPCKEVFVGAAVSGSYVALLMLRRQGRKRWLIASEVALLLVVIGAVAEGWRKVDTSASLQHRVELWVNTFFIWWDRPLWGRGLGSFDYVYPTFMAAYRHAFPHLDPTTVPQMLSYAGAAHNEPLQLLTELGLIGFVLMAIVIVLVWRRQPPLGARSIVDHAAALQLAIAGTVSLLDFVFQNPALLLISLSSLAIMANTGRPPRRNDTASPAIALPRGAALAGAAILAAFLIVLTGTMARHAVAQRHFGWAQRVLNMSPRAGFLNNNAAYAAFPLDPAYRRQLFISLMVWLSSGQNVPYTTDAQTAFYRVSASAGPDWPGLLITRIFQLLLNDQQGPASAEIETLLASAKLRAPHLPDVYFAEALFAMKSDDLKRAHGALDEAARRMDEVKATYEGPEMNTRLEMLRAELAQRDAAADAGQ